mgnify:CR=1 FL=1
MKFRNALFVGIGLLLYINCKGQYTDSLLLHLPLDGHAIDFSGNNHHGVLNGGTPTYDYFGNPNSAIYFDGSDDFIEIGDVIDIDEQIGVSISAWFKPDTILSQQNRYAGISFGTKESGRLELRFSKEDSMNFSSAITSGSSFSWNGNGTNNWSERVNYNQWYHIVSTYQDTSIKTYINGQKSSSYVSTANNGGWFYYVQDNAKLRIAKAYNTNNQERFYRGVIDEVYVHYKVLDSTTVRLMYQDLTSDLSEEKFVNREITLGPNPSNGKIHFNSNVGIIKSIYVYNSNGEIIKRVKLNLNSGSLNLQNFEKGLYYVRIQTNKDLITRKISIY